MKVAQIISSALLLLIISLLVGCLPNRTPQITLRDPIVFQFDSISSSSGVTTIENSVFVVGDDSPFLYELNSDLSIVYKVQLSGVDSIVNGRVPSAVKADFECMEVIDNDKLLILSSCSVPVSRDTAYLVNLKELTFISRNLRDFFQRIIAEANLGSESEINIEAITTINDSIYFMHCGNLSLNFIASSSLEKFLDYIKAGSEIPKVHIHKFALPKFENFSSGFSGACISPDKKGIIFTASLEATNSEVSDGEVKGSFIGYIPLISMSKGIYSSALLRDEKENIMPLKLEGISVLNNKSNTNEQFQVITVIDNDDGTSKIIEAYN